MSPGPKVAAGVVDESTKLSAVVGARSAGPLARARDLQTVGDLLEFWPRRYLEHTADLSNLHVGMYVVVVGRVKTSGSRRTMPSSLHIDSTGRS